MVHYVNQSSSEAGVEYLSTSPITAQIVAAMPRRTVVMTSTNGWWSVTRQVLSKWIFWWNGAYIAQEYFTPQNLGDFRSCHLGLRPLSISNAPPNVVADADFAGRTAHRHTGYPDTCR